MVPWKVPLGPLTVRTIYNKRTKKVSKKMYSSASSLLLSDATNVVHAGSPVITISIYTEAGDGVSVSSSLPIKFDVNVPQNGTKFPSFQELAYAIWPCGDFVLDTVSNVIERRISFPIN